MFRGRRRHQSVRRSMRLLTTRDESESKQSFYSLKSERSVPAGLHQFNYHGAPLQYRVPLLSRTAMGTVANNTHTPQEYAKSYEWPIYHCQGSAPTPPTHTHRVTRSHMCTNMAQKGTVWRCDLDLAVSARHPLNVLSAEGGDPISARAPARG